MLALVPPLAALLISTLGMTLRYRDVIKPGAVQGHLVPGPCVFAFWHRCLVTCAYRFRNKDIAILISPSFDGELIARTVEWLGFYPVRGSSSRGGAAGLRNMERAYRDGHRCAITADGPRGPAMVAKPGTAQLAHLVDSPVGVFYAVPERAWVLKTWDGFLIPKPFSRVVFTWPAEIPKSDPDLQTATQRALDEAVDMAKPF
jgi:lysophospholipid acyltransferase (LPLAT)-like uncharacterized protein